MESCRVVGEWGPGVLRSMVRNPFFGEGIKMGQGDYVQYIIHSYKKMCGAKSTMHSHVSQKLNFINGRLHEVLSVVDCIEFYQW